MKKLLISVGIVASLIACAALPSFASEPPVMGISQNDFNDRHEVHTPENGFSAAPVVPANVPSELELVERLVQWTPQFIVDIVAVWANYLIIAASALMLILRLLGWFLPASFTRLLGPIANWFRWLTRLLDIIALNSNKNTGGPNKNRRGG